MTDALEIEDEVEDEVEPDPRIGLETVLANVDASTRKFLIEWFVEAVHHADTNNPASWAVTTRRAPSRVRLLVGSTVACELGVSHVGLGLHAPSLPDPANSASDLGTNDSRFSRIDGGVFRKFSHSRFLAHHEQLRDAAFQFITLAAKSRSPYAKFHRPDLLAELNAASGVSLPNPAHASAVELVPLPATKRHKGLTSISSLDAIIAILRTVGEDITRDELFAAIRIELPHHKDSTLSSVVYMLKSELGVITRKGQLYRVSPIGAALIDSEDPDALRDWMLTRVLGVDWALVQSSRRGPLSSNEFQRLIQEANPGWKALKVPHSLFNWMKALDLLTHENKAWTLSERGRAWLSQIHWEPETLAPDPGVEISEPIEATRAYQPLGFDPFESLYARMSLPFPKYLVGQLHAGLWSHPRRHFAVLTGLSGSGKTQLARDYARAIAGEDEGAIKRVKVIPVQPGWYDPGPLLGYVNPMQPNDYVQTYFLEFMFQALAEPDKPYVVVLDEMNLSQPEQYLAPLLSAMETGEAIDLHDDDQLVGVERRLPYPSNLAIIGTVNMDETTHGLSDKVLDRAFTLEFWKIEVDAWPGWSTSVLPEAELDSVRKLLGELMAALQPARMHFGWRVIVEVVAFLERMREFGTTEGYMKDLDAILYAKVLPKLRGEDSKRFHEALVTAREALKGCERCVAKLEELEHDLTTTGSARFFR
ncbi:McrB family protein [Nannocystaceae bacterium ST9]